MSLEKHKHNRHCEWFFLRHERKIVSRDALKLMMNSNHKHPPNLPLREEILNPTVISSGFS
jgi:hypothetical protein